MHNHEPEELDKISNYVSAPSIGDDMNDNDDVVKVKREYNDGYEEDYDAKAYKEHKKVCDTFSILICIPKSFFITNI